MLYSKRMKYSNPSVNYEYKFRSNIIIYMQKIFQRSIRIHAINFDLSNLSSIWFLNFKFITLFVISIKPFVTDSGEKTSFHRLLLLFTLFHIIFEIQMFCFGNSNPIELLLINN